MWLEFGCGCPFSIVTIISTQSNNSTHSHRSITTLTHSTLVYSVYKLFSVFYPSPITNFTPSKEQLRHSTPTTRCYDQQPPLYDSSPKGAERFKDAQYPSAPA